MPCQKTDTDRLIMLAERYGKGWAISGPWHQSARAYEVIAPSGACFESTDSITEALEHVLRHAEEA